MTRNLGLIIFLLFVAWQVVSAIINQANANKQQQRAEELAKRRRETAGGAATAGGDGSAGGKSRIDDLAARRKAQLEELRRRRDAGQAAPTTTQARIGGPAAGTAPPTPIAPTSRQRTIRIEPVGRERKPDPWAARKESQRLERDATRNKAQDAAQLRAKQQAQSQQLAARERMAVQQRAEMRAASFARESAAEAADALKAAEPGVIRRRIHNAQELRELFVLKELLDRPVALRAEQTG